MLVSKAKPFLMSQIQTMMNGQAREFTALDRTIWLEGFHPGRMVGELGGRFRASYMGPDGRCRYMGISLRDFRIKDGTVYIRKSKYRSIFINLKEEPIWNSIGDLQ